MQTLEWLGVPWWGWTLVALALVVLVVQVRRSAARSAHRQQEERLAQRADAMHEGARTRHEGGP